MTRHIDSSGDPMLVKLPMKEEGGWQNSREGGLAFYFLIPKKPYEKDRCACIPYGTPMWGGVDCLIYPHKKVYEAFEHPIEVDGAILIGSTGLSLWDGSEHFHATYKSLTDEGKHLYNILKKLYGTVDIITLLDTQNDTN